jgi:1-acyl-sn-glycerol-3-phosphate acyltransferase
MSQPIPPLELEGLPRISSGGKAFGALRLVYEYVAFSALWFVFGLTSLLWSIPAAVLYCLMPNRSGEVVGQFLMMAGFRFFVGAMRATGIIKCNLGALQLLRDEKAFVIAPNHPSLLDAVLIISQLPNVVCIAKPEIWDNLFLGAGARLAGFIRNDAPIKLIKTAAEKIQTGRHLLIFPEGTRTLSGSINNFKGGFALIAKRADVPVQTVFIESNSRFLSKSWPYFKKPVFPLIYSVRLGHRFTVGKDVETFIEKLETYYREQLQDSRPRL